MTQNSACPGCENGSFLVNGQCYCCDDETHGISNCFACIYDATLKGPICTSCDPDFKIVTNFGSSYCIPKKIFGFSGTEFTFISLLSIVLLFGLIVGIVCLVNYLRDRKRQKKNAKL
ncbi:High cysteine membrane protein [Giardia muris]|uniref:High cysteine membrane protein n=1 Tax=Giardia muris TaxID=5742 RepID=A0A4Z1SUL7_GIAMU|nr:High cysteine membrane protein [Giardia muris]|eukprot:TNJ28655.1 High cysteine membrane protein [Giardia muris]